MSRLMLPARSAHGFSLVEVMTVIGLFGIISTIAVTNFTAMMPAYRVRGAALQVAGDMNLARLSALKEGRRYYYTPLAGTRYRIEFDAAGGGLTTLKTVDIAADYPQVTFGSTGVALDPYGGIANPAAVPATSITFNSDGTVTNAAGVYVQPSTTGAHSHHAVTVTAAGRIRAWNYNGSTWR